MKKHVPGHPAPATGSPLAGVLLMVGVLAFGIGSAAMVLYGGDKDPAPVSQPAQATQFAPKADSIEAVASEPEAALTEQAPQATAAAASSVEAAPQPEAAAASAPEAASPESAKEQEPNKAPADAAPPATEKAPESKPAAKPVVEAAPAGKATPKPAAKPEPRKIEAKKPETKKVEPVTQARAQKPAAREQAPSRAPVQVEVVKPKTEPTVVRQAEEAAPKPVMVDSKASRPSALGSNVPLDAATPPAQAARAAAPQPAAPALTVRPVVAPSLVPSSPQVVHATAERAWVRLDDHRTVIVHKGQEVPGLGAYQGLEGRNARFESGLVPLAN